MKKKHFSVIIPVYNEEELIRKNTLKLIRFLDKLNKPYEIILSNNGSTDRTLILAKQLESEFPDKVKVVTCPVAGIGLAFKNAMKMVTARNVVCIDMDLPIQLIFIPKCIELLEKGYSVVIGSKILGRQRRGYRKFFTKLFVRLTNAILGLPYSDYSPNGKGFRLPLAVDSSKLDNSSFYTTQLIYYSRESGKKIVEIPVICEDVRPSRFNIFYEGMRRLIKLFSFRFSTLLKTKKIPM